MLHVWLVEVVFTDIALFVHHLYLIQLKRIVIVIVFRLNKHIFLDQC